MVENKIKLEDVKNCYNCYNSFKDKKILEDRICDMSGKRLSDIECNNGCQWWKERLIKTKKEK